MKRASFSMPTNAILEIKTILNSSGKSHLSFPNYSLLVFCTMCQCNMDKYC